MSRYLRQSTASQTRTIGPFLDAADYSEETGLTINASDIRLKKNGADDVAKNSGGATHDVNGCYHLTFDATDTDTVGELFYTVKISAVLQVFGSFTVLEEPIYDALFAASANAFQGAAGSTKVTGVALVDTLTTYTGNTPQTADHTANIAAILTDTAEIGAAGAGLTNINLPNQTMDIVGNITGNLSGSVGSVTAGVTLADDAITASKYDESTAFPLTAVNGSSLTEAGGTGDHLTALSLSTAGMQALIELCFTYDATATYASADAGSLVKQIADNAGGSGLTLGAIADAVWDEDLTGHTTTDSAGEILGNVATGTPPTAAAIADAVWDEATSGHTTSGTFGEQLKTDVDAILADTNELQTDDYPTTLATLATSAELAKVPKSDGTATWNATALASIQQEATDALNAYDPPTNAEMEARTLVAADYATNTDLDALITTVGVAGAGLTEAGGTGDQLTALATAASIAALNNLSAAQVNAEVVDVLTVDTFAEPTGVPAATTTLRNMLGFVYSFGFRNKITVTSSKMTFHDDGDAAEFEKDVSDDGTTYTESEANSI